MSGAVSCSDPMPSSSNTTGLMSRDAVDRRRSNVGPGAVQDDACRAVFDALRSHLGRDYVKKLCRAIDAKPGTVKKWFLGQNGPNRDHWDRINAEFGVVLRGPSLRGGDAPRPLERVA